MRLILAADAFLPHEEPAVHPARPVRRQREGPPGRARRRRDTWTDNQAVQVIIDGQPAVEASGTGQAARDRHLRTGRQAVPAALQDRRQERSQAGRDRPLHAAVRQRRRPEDRQRHDHRQPDAAAGIRRRLGRVDASRPTSRPRRKLPGESLVLRWEIEEPLEVNQGGIIRFQARGEVGQPAATACQSDAGAGVRTCSTTITSGAI